MATEFAWVIEKGPEPRYYAPTEPGEWSLDHLKACRFARKEDAEVVQFRHVTHGHLPVDGTRVCEHGWFDGEAEIDTVARFRERLHKMFGEAADRINAAR